MNQVSFPVDASTRFLIQLAKDVCVEPVDELTFSAEYCEGDNFSTDQKDNTVSITCDGDCCLHIPRKAEIEAVKIRGDFSGHDFPKPIQMKWVGGDLYLARVGGFSVLTVGGDCSLLNIEGESTLQSVGGDLEVVNCGRITVENVGGDARLIDILGGLSLRAGGDIQMRWKDASISSTSLLAGGDVYLILPTKANAELILSSGGMDIDLEWGGQHWHVETGRYETCLGAGGTCIQVAAGGDVMVRDVANGKMENMLDNMDEHMEHMKTQLGRDIFKRTRISNRLAEEMSKRTNEINRRASERVEAAMRRIEKKTPFSFSMGFPGVERKPEQPAAPAPRSTISDAERDMVLKMLQDKKITVEEADQLLRALAE